jgi:hypothetical protein
MSSRSFSKDAINLLGRHYFCLDATDSDRHVRICRNFHGVVVTTRGEKHENSWKQVKIAIIMHQKISKTKV